MTSNNKGYLKIKSSISMNLKSHEKVKKENKMDQTPQYTENKTDCHIKNYQSLNKYQIVSKFRSTLSKRTTTHDPEMLLPKSSLNRKMSNGEQQLAVSQFEFPSKAGCQKVPAAVSVFEIQQKQESNIDISEMISEEDHNVIINNMHCASPSPSSHLMRSTNFEQDEMSRNDSLMSLDVSFQSQEDNKSILDFTDNICNMENLENDKCYNKWEKNFQHSFFSSPTFTDITVPTSLNHSPCTDALCSSSSKLGNFDGKAFESEDATDPSNCSMWDFNETSIKSDFQDHNRWNYNIGQNTSCAFDNSSRFSDCNNCSEIKHSKNYFNSEKNSSNSGKSECISLPPISVSSVNAGNQFRKTRHSISSALYKYKTSSLKMKVLSKSLSLNSSFVDISSQRASDVENSNKSNNPILTSVYPLTSSTIDAATSNEFTNLKKESPLGLKTSDVLTSTSDKVTAEGSKTSTLKCKSKRAVQMASIWNKWNDCQGHQKSTNENGIESASKCVTSVSPVNEKSHDHSTASQFGYAGNKRITRKGAFNSYSLRNTGFNEKYGGFVDTRASPLPILKRDLCYKSTGAIISHLRLKINDTFHQSAEIELPAPSQPEVINGSNANRCKSYWLSAAATISPKESHHLVPVAYDWQSLPSTKYSVGFIDTHCHLDFLFSRVGHSGTLAEFKMKVAAETEDLLKFPVSFEGCIAVFCQPDTFQKVSWYSKLLEEEGVWGAFGCHPHFSDRFGVQELYHLRQALKHRKVMALGEIGLDYSHKNSLTPAVQQSVFRQQLLLAVELQLPLVIHSREADDDTLQILKKHVSPDTRIHRHCFTESWQLADEWLRVFPNCFLGFTNLITQRGGRARQVCEVVRRMPLDRLLLETDAPYFTPDCVRSHGASHSHPGHALHVAAEVARLRGLSLDEVLVAVRDNTARMYGV